MLNPKTRSLLTDGLTPPAGMVFDAGVATTYSLDPAALLTLPLHMAWLADAGQADERMDPIRLLESLRRVTDRFTVFHENGRIAAPAAPNPLFGRLEEMMYPCVAPGGGAFHSKVLLLSFRDERGDEQINGQRSIGRTLRLLVLSRNLTFDNAWDVAVQLDGVPGPVDQPEQNTPIRGLFERARTASVKEMPAARAAILANLLADLDDCQWALPTGFDSAAFHLIGDSDAPLDMSRCDRLAVISPFLTESALARLAETTRHFSWLLSRPEALGALSHTHRALASNILVLADRASEPGESSESTGGDMLAGAGLHAKCFVQERGTRTHLFAGSANATHPVFGADSNIRNTEFMVELSGPRRCVGSLDAIFGDGGLQDVCQRYEHIEAAADDELAYVDRRLDAALRAIAKSAWTLGCDGTADAWYLTLISSGPVDEGALLDISIDVWPLTVERHRATPLSGKPLEARMGPLRTIELTSLTGFELSYRGHQRRFGLEIPVTGMPSAAQRDQAALHHVVRNRPAFLRYLALLLGDLAGNVGAQALAARLGATSGFGAMPAGGSIAAMAELPLFEQLARAYARDPDSLGAVERVMRQLADSTDEHGEPVVPDGFRELWAVFEATLNREAARARA